MSRYGLVLPNGSVVNLEKFFDIKDSPEGASPSCAGVTPGSISKSQGGLG